MGTPGVKSVDALNDAFNQLHRDVCDAGRPAAGLCSDVARARDAWRVVWQSFASASAPSSVFDEWHAKYVALRARAIAERVNVNAPKRVASPSERAKKAIKDAARVGHNVLVVVVVVAVLAWVSSRQTDQRRVA